MKLVIGGAYQGKLAYAKKNCHMEDGWIDGRTCDFDEILSCRGIFCFHEYIKRLLCCAKETRSESSACKDTVFLSFSGSDLIHLEESADQFVKILLEKNHEIVIVSDELGYGIVPIEKQDRIWRETVGRVCTCAAGCADEVVRVVCGIGMKLK